MNNQPNEKMLKALGLTEWPPMPMNKRVQMLQKENEELKEQMAEQSAALVELAALIEGGNENG